MQSNSEDRITPAICCRVQAIPGRLRTGVHELSYFDKHYCLAFTTFFGALGAILGAATIACDGLDPNGPWFWVVIMSGIGLTYAIMRQGQKMIARNVENNYDDPEHGEIEKPTISVRQRKISERYAALEQHERLVKAEEARMLLRAAHRTPGDWQLWT